MSLSGKRRLEKFHARYRMDEVTGCWVWTGWRNHRRGDYGQIRVNYRSVRAHRFSWEIHNGPIPAGLVVLHGCDNPPCVNPAHLSLGTNLDNIEDRKLKRRGRGECKARHGNTNGSARLTAELAREIRELWRKGQRGHGAPALARRFGVSTSTVSRVVRGVTWAEAS